MVAAPRDAVALDKQGSAHGGDVEGASTGLDVAGSAAVAVAAYNPSYAARPDNSGRALFRYALHLDVDLVGRRLSIPVDVNTFTDRERRGARLFAPSELDVISGLTSTSRLGPGALEGGIRVESDMPVDRRGLSQTYVDARARYLFSAASVSPAIRRTLAGGDLSGWTTLGVFALNPTYAARPDNSGRALLRYALHGELSCWDERAAVALDGTLFTDRRTSAVAPSELDFTPELIGRADPFEFHLAYELDAPVDRRGSRPGFTQSFVYVLAAWAFDVIPPPEPQATTEGASTPASPGAR